MDLRLILNDSVEGELAVSGSSLGNDSSPAIHREHITSSVDHLIVADPEVQSSHDEADEDLSIVESTEHIDQYPTSKYPGHTSSTNSTVLGHETEDDSTASVTTVVQDDHTPSSKTSTTATSHLRGGGRPRARHPREMKVYPAGTADDAIFAGPLEYIKGPNLLRLADHLPMAEIVARTNAAHPATEGSEAAVEKSMMQKRLMRAVEEAAKEEGVAKSVVQARLRAEQKRHGLRVIGSAKKADIVEAKSMATKITGKRKQEELEESSSPEPQVKKQKKQKAIKRKPSTTEKDERCDTRRTETYRHCNTDDEHRVTAPIVNTNASFKRKSRASDDGLPTTSASASLPTPLSATFMAITEPAADLPPAPSKRVKSTHDSSGHNIANVEQPRTTASKTATKSILRLPLPVSYWTTPTTANPLDKPPPTPISPFNAPSPPSIAAAPPPSNAPAGPAKQPVTASISEPSRTLPPLCATKAFGHWTPSNEHPAVPLRLPSLRDLPGHEEDTTTHSATAVSSSKLRTLRPAKTTIATTVNGTGLQQSTASGLADSAFPSSSAESTWTIQGNFGKFRPL